MDEKIIEFNNVTFMYDAEDEETGVASAPAVKGVTLAINRGEFVAVLGRNGSGKSTLAKLCNAIYEPYEGDVIVEGMNTREEENGDKIRRRVDEALKSVNMYEHRLRQPHNLSGGQKQRVAIAGVLAMQTDCIVLDEPTAMLDPVGRAEVLQTVKRLNKELGITVIMVTHFMDEAVEADRVVVMSSGEIVMDGTPQQVFSDIEKVRAYGLDVPQSTALCAALSIKENVLNAQQCVDVIDRICGGAK